MIELPYLFLSRAPYRAGHKCPRPPTARTGGGSGEERPRGPSESYSDVIMRSDRLAPLQESWIVALRARSIAPEAPHSSLFDKQQHVIRRPEWVIMPIYNG